MSKFQLAIAAVASALIIAVSAACAADAASIADPSGPNGSDATARSAASDLSTATPNAAGLRLRCERRANRSKISVDGRNLTPRGGTFRARVRAGGGTATSGTQRAVGDEAEFDFDSNRNDVREGATRIAANFVRSRPGADVMAEILNAQGRVVATQSGECDSR